MTWRIMMGRNSIVSLFDQICAGHACTVAGGGRGHRYDVVLPGSGGDEGEDVVHGVSVGAHLLLDAKLSHLSRPTRPSLVTAVALPSPRTSLKRSPAGPRLIGQGETDAITHI